MRFCSIVLSKPPLYLHVTTTTPMILHSLSRIFFPPRYITKVLPPVILTHYKRLHFVIRSFTVSLSYCYTLRRSFLPLARDITVFLYTVAYPYNINIEIDKNDKNYANKD